MTAGKKQVLRFAQDENFFMIVKLSHYHGADKSVRPTQDDNFFMIIKLGR